MTHAHHEPAELERVILRLLSERSPEGSICPSDAARAARPEGWRALMNEVRAAAQRLAVRGDVDITQGDRVVDIAVAAVRCAFAGTGRTERRASSPGR